MNYYALIAGIVIAVYVVVRFKKTKLEKRKWAYPAFLATFPIYYWIFAIYAANYGALINEIGIGLAFILIAYIAYRLNSVIRLILLATGYILHAGYDVIHDSLFINPGTPVWWPEFCGSVDLLIGLYLLYLVVSVRGRVTKSA